MSCSLHLGLPHGKPHYLEWSTGPTIQVSGCLNTTEPHCACRSGALGLLGLEEEGGEGPECITTFPNSFPASSHSHELQEGQITSTLLELRIRPLVLSPNPATKSGHFFFPKSAFALDHCHSPLPDFSASSTVLLQLICYILQKVFIFLEHLSLSCSQTFSGSPVSR